VFPKGKVTLVDQGNQESPRQNRQFVIAAGSKSDDRLAKAVKGQSSRILCDWDALKARNGFSRCGRVRKLAGNIGQKPILPFLAKGNKKGDSMAVVD